MLVLQLVQIGLFSAVAMGQQQALGNVGVQDATVTGALQIENGRAMLVGNTTVTAKDHTAEIALDRGGKVLVCATSGLHLSPGKSLPGVQPLMLSLDRGAIEVQMAATANDAVLTPDLRFVIQGAGPLDLRLRVSRSGDTCVENRGSNAPILHISDTFGDASYDLHSGQHVLFEHASLKEVVDHESSPCGCPPQPVVSVADAGASSSTLALPGSAAAAQQAAQEHPFPAAVSQGLAPGPPVPAAPPGAVHTQVAATLSFDAAAPAGNGAGAGTTPDSTSVPAGSSPAPAAPNVVAIPAAPANPPADVRAEAPPPPAAPSGTDLVHRIGHFFKRLFGQG
ncbi:nuclease [Granulicella sp. dw_53]|uniref:nuclease n=1 Tax=Granulicella sp. dw_53 TaxID=2719792 RepID=UPI001BD6B25F|nr:nuclease [Granulicella sp. dw_53]